MLQKQDSNPIKKVIYPLPQKNRNDAIQSKRKRVIICKNTHPHFHCLKWNSDYRKKNKKQKTKTKTKKTKSIYFKFMWKETCIKRINILHLFYCKWSCFHFWTTPRYMLGVLCQFPMLPLLFWKSNNILIQSHATCNIKWRKFSKHHILTTRLICVISNQNHKVGWSECQVFTSFLNLTAMISY